MHRFLTLIFLFSISFVVIFIDCPAYAENSSMNMDLVLDSAERFFVSLRDGEYETAWGLLSEKSHETIIDDVHASARKMNGEIKKEVVLKDFKMMGLMFTNYWNAFSSAFDVNLILRQSRWEKGFIKKNKAEIILMYEKSGGPTRLKLYREGGIWKVGLIETFWNRKGVKFLSPVLKLLSNDK